MKYSILGFNQKAVSEITKDVIVEHKGGDKKYKTLKLDCADLLILQDVADFMNRKKIIKYTVDDKIYFSIQYSAIIDDLPILGIKQQALSDRLSKLVELEMLEKTVIKNQSGSFVAFRLGEKYESIKYTPNTTNNSTSSETPCTSSELHLQEYQTTSANVVDYTPKYSFTNNSSTNNKNKEGIDKSIPKKRQKFDVRADLSYVDSKYANLWNEWLDYKDAINKQYKTQKGAISQYKSWIKFANNNIILAEAIVRRSIEYSWQGLFELKDNEIKLYLSNRNPYNSNNQQPYNGSNRLIDGENEDGTFNRNGYRYYHSMRDNRDYSIPINAVPMPSFDCEFDMKTEKWYHPDIKNDVNGDLW